MSLLQVAGLQVRYGGIRAVKGIEAEIKLDGVVQAVPVGVGDRRVGPVKICLFPVREPVPVGVVTAVADAVPVRVGLVGIMDIWAVIAGIADAVAGNSSAR